MNLTVKSLDQLTRPGPRLPWITNRLLNDIWSPDPFNRLSAEDFLVRGEKQVHEVEELLAAAGWRFYDELVAAATQAGGLLENLNPETALVIFDGLSLRETPLLMQKASESGFRVIENKTAFAALPSETLDFVDQRLIGKRVSPKSMPQRGELRERRIQCYYFNDATATQPIECEDNEALLLWSAFPDVTYQDSGARFTRHFSEIQNLFEAAWKNIVMQIPRGRRIILTSDHGYIFFGAGFDSIRHSEGLGVLNQDRYRRFESNESLPNPEQFVELQILSDRRLAMVRGRIKNNPRGPGGNRLYRHGGLSLMEMLVPWLILERD